MPEICEWIESKNFNYVFFNYLYIYIYYVLLLDLFKIAQTKKANTNTREYKHDKNIYGPEFIKLRLTRFGRPSLFSTIVRFAPRRRRRRGRRRRRQ